MAIKRFNGRGKLWRRGMALLSMLLLLICMTGCHKRYVVVPGGETITISKATLDTLYNDNERLLQALKECQD
jgi:hypothetical protein